jgi:hypothetical protein
MTHFHDKQFKILENRDVLNWASSFLYFLIANEWSYLIPEAINTKITRVEQLQKYYKTIISFLDGCRAQCTY